MNQIPIPLMMDPVMRGLKLSVQADEMTSEYDDWMIIRLVLNFDIYE